MDPPHHERLSRGKLLEIPGEGPAKNVRLLMMKKYNDNLKKKKSIIKLEGETGERL